VGEKEIADRNFVYAFKDGKAYEEVARMTASSMKEQYGETCTDIVFSPVPASTDKKNEIRYKAFCERVCELTGAINGFDHVKVAGGRLAIHENRKLEKEIRNGTFLPHMVQEGLCPEQRRKMNSIWMSIRKLWREYIQPQ
jgi:hypothetical protein